MTDPAAGPRGTALRRRRRRCRRLGVPDRPSSRPRRDSRRVTACPPGTSRRRYDPPSWSRRPRPAAPRLRRPGRAHRRRPPASSGLLDRDYDETGPLVEPEWWAYGSSDDPRPPAARPAQRRRRPRRHAGSDGTATTVRRAAAHPSAPLPPRPAGRVGPAAPPRGRPVDDAETVAQPAVGGAPLDRPAASGPDSRRRWADDRRGRRRTDAHPSTRTPRPARLGGPDRRPRGHRRPRRGGAPRRRGRRAPPRAARRRPRSEACARRGRRRGRPAACDHDDDDALVHDEAFGEDIPVKPYDRADRPGAPPRSPFAVLVSLLVLAGLVVGIVLGGQKLLDADQPGVAGLHRPGHRRGADPRPGRRHAQRHRPHAGRRPTSSPRSARSSTPPRPTPTRSGIQPGVYGMRAADERPGRPRPAARPGGAAALAGHRCPRASPSTRTLARLAEQTGMPIEEFQAAAADPAALGLPAYANGSLEGFLFPATYDVEPDTAPADILRQMVARGRAGARPSCRSPRPSGSRCSPRPASCRPRPARSRTWARSPGSWRTGSPTACRCSWTPR